MQFHHIGYLLENMADGIEAFKKLGYKIEKDPVLDGSRQVEICFLSGPTNVELIVPTKECKLFKSLQDKIGNGPYHICYDSDDIEADIINLKNAGWLQISKVEPAIAIDNRHVVFFFSKDIGIIEIVSMK